MFLDSQRPILVQKLEILKGIRDILSVQSEPKKHQNLAYFLDQNKSLRVLETHLMTGNAVPNTKIMFERIYLD